MPSCRETVVIMFYEFLGTAMLLLGYNFTSAGVPVAFSLFVGILIAGKISGGMFNPAVTLAIFISDGSALSNIFLMILIILSQICGAFFGIIYAHIVLGAPAVLCPYDSNSGCVSYDGFASVFLLELWCTFFFCLCILVQVNKDSQETRDGVLGAAAIAFTLMAMIQTAGSISGGCFNPAFGLT